MQDVLARFRQRQLKRSHSTSSSRSRSNSSSSSSSTDGQPQPNAALLRALQTSGLHTANGNHLNTLLANLAGQKAMGDKSVLYVSGLEWWTTDKTLHEAFAQHGIVTQLKIHADRISGKSKGYAYVEFGGANHLMEALRAQRSLNGYLLDGKQIAVVATTPDKINHPEYSDDNETARKEQNEALSKVLPNLGKQIGNLGPIAGANNPLKTLGASLPTGASLGAIGKDIPGLPPLPNLAALGRGLPNLGGYGRSLPYQQQAARGLQHGVSLPGSNPLGAWGLQPPGSIPILQNLRRMSAGSASSPFGSPIPARSQNTPPSALRSHPTLAGLPGVNPMLAAMLAGGQKLSSQARKGHQKKRKKKRRKRSRSSSSSSSGKKRKKKRS